MSSSSKRRPTRSASSSGPVIVISLPRTRIVGSNADSTSFRKASRCPSRATIGWLPGTRIFTWVVAFAKRYRGAGPLFLLCRTRPPPSAVPATHSIDGKAAGVVPDGLAGRPRHLAAPKQMHVQVGHRLTTGGPDVGHQAPAIIQALGRSHVVRSPKDVHEQACVGVREVLDRVQVLPRNDEDVRGRLRIRV